MKNKINTILLVIVILLQCVILLKINNSTFDVDQDKEVTARDYIIIKEYIMNEQ